MALVTFGTAAIIGGPSVFDMFMDRYDVFWLSQAHQVNIPGGIGGFPGIPEQTPQEILTAHGLKAVLHPHSIPMSEAGGEDGERLFG